MTNKDLYSEEEYEAQILEYAASSMRHFEFIDPAFPCQTEFIKDPSRRKAALTTRRAGKSEGCVRYMLHTSFSKPMARCAYVGLTRQAAKNTVWHIFQRLDREMGLDLSMPETELIIKCANFSEMLIVGADAKQEEKEKLRGQPFDLVVVDECASWRSHLRSLIVDILIPALVDRMGTIALIGTPGEILSGIFYDVTTGQEKGYSLHQWTAHENPYVARQFKAHIEELKEADPDVESRPFFQREYLGKWVLDTESLCYVFDPARNTFDELDSHGWLFGLGIDLGWNDPSAFVLCCFHPKFTGVFHIIEAWKRSKMLLTDVAEVVETYRKQYRLRHIVIDNADKQSVEEMRSRYRIPFEAAGKRGKTEWIGVMNADMMAGKVKVRPDACDDLIHEWANLTWEKEKVPRREDPRGINHCADAALYIYRRASHYLHDASKEAKMPDEYAKMHPEERRMLMRDDYEFHKQKNKAWWDV